MVAPPGPGGVRVGTGRRRSLYEVLGVPTVATSDELRRAFKRRALETHPDKGGEAWVFQAVLAAFETLADAARRARYDLALDEGNPEAAEASARPRPRGTPKAPEARPQAAGRPGGGPRAAAAPAAAPAAAGTPPPRRFTPERGFAWGTPPRTPGQRPGPPPAPDRPWRVRHEALPGQLAACLRRLGPERRRVVISQQLSVAQRLAIERWVQERKACDERHERPDGRAGAPPGTLACGSDDESFASASESEEAEPALALEDGAATESEGEGEGAQPGDEPGADGGAADQEQAKTPSDGVGAAPSRGMMRGIARHFRHRSIYYSAMVSMGALYVTTREDTNLETILDFLCTLTAVKERVGSDYFDEAMPDLFMQAVESACREAGLCPTRQMGLRVQVRISAHQWTGGEMHSPSFRYAEKRNGVTAMSAWRLLTSARGRANRGGHVFHFCSPAELGVQWQHLREVYADIWAANPAEREAVCVRLDAAAAAHWPQRERELERWNRAAMAREEQRTRRVFREELRSRKRERSAMADAARESRMAERQERRARATESAEERAERRIAKLLALWGQREAKERLLAQQRQEKDRREARLVAARAAAEKARAARSARAALRGACRSWKDQTMAEILGKGRRVPSR